MAQLENKHWWFLAKRQFINSLLPHKSNLNILDLGCGTGGTTLFLGGWGKVTGVENEETAILFLKKRGVKYIKKSINNINFPQNKFDLICLLDVLYHQNIKNDFEVLGKTYSWLKKDGLLLITDSACPSLLSKHDKIMMARQRYSLTDLSQKVKKAHFTIEKKSYIFFLLFPLFFLSRLINKYLEFPTVKQEGAILNKIFLGICKVEAELLKYVNYPIGSSIIIMAKKQ